MPANKRIFYAVQSASVSKCGLNTFTAIKGLQSIGINTKFNLEQIFELGQIAIYEQIENIPDIDVTVEKVLDGFPLIYHLMTFGATSATLVGRSNVRCTLGLSIYSDIQESASGTPVAQCTMSGLYVSSLNYNFQVQGNSTESVTAVGGNKVWNNVYTSPSFNNTDVPLAAEGANRREDVLFGSAGCKIPQDIPGVSASGTNELGIGEFSAHLQSIKISANLGREAMYELGRRGPYHRYVNFPVEVKTDFEVISQAGDTVSCYEDTSSLIDRVIVVKTREGTVLDMGTRNKLNSVTYGGANAGQNGGNAMVTYSYSGYNDMKVTHPQDPSALT